MMIYTSSRPINTEWIFIPPADVPLTYETYQDKIAPHLSGADKKGVSMEAVVASLTPPCSVRGIPKTLYDLFVVHGVYTNVVETCPRSELEVHSSRMASARRAKAEDVVPALLRARDSEKSTQKAHFAVNAHIGQHLRNIAKLDDSSCRAFINVLLKDLRPFERQKRAKTTSRRARNLLLSAMRMEMENPEGVTFYRAGYLSYDRAVAAEGRHATSFGSTPLMGLIWDTFDGCVLGRAYDERPVYAANITNPEQLSLFHAPDLRQSHRCLSSGEYLHPRAKAARQSTHRNSLVDVYEPQMPFIAPDAFYLPPGQASAFELIPMVRLVHGNTSVFVLLMRGLMLSGLLYEGPRLLPAYFLLHLMTSSLGQDYVWCYTYKALKTLWPSEFAGGLGRLMQPSASVVRDAAYDVL